MPEQWCLWKIKRRKWMPAKNINNKLSIWRRFEQKKTRLGILHPPTEQRACGVRSMRERRVSDGEQRQWNCERAVSVWERNVENSAVRRSPRTVIVCCLFHEHNMRARQLTIVSKIVSIRCVISKQRKRSTRWNKVIIKLTVWFPLNIKKTTYKRLEHFNRIEMEWRLYDGENSKLEASFKNMLLTNLRNRLERFLGL